MIDAGLLDPLVHGTRALDLTGDAAFLAAMVDSELALSRALVDAGLAPEWMLTVCTSLTAPDLDALAADARGGGNPVIPLLRHLQASADALHPSASDHLHVGATSQDILDTAAMLVARSVCGEVLSRLSELAQALAELAVAHRSTAMVGRTLGQHAAPTTFGFVVAGWLHGVTTAIEAVDVARAGLPVQYGGAVGTRAVLDDAAAARGGSADAVATAFAGRLGLRSPPISWHSNRAPVLALASALAGAVAAVGVIAVDVTVLSRTEIAEVTEHDERGAAGSSAMPHKRNPVTAVLVTAAARRAPHALAAVFAAALSEDQRASGAWHAEWLPLRELERIAVSATAGAATLLTHLTVDHDRMATNLGLSGGLVFSERLSAALAELLGRQAAFDLVRRGSRQSEQSGRTLRETVIALLDEGDYAADVFDAVHRACTVTTGPSIHRAIDEVVSAFQARASARSDEEES